MQQGNPDQSDVVDIDALVIPAVCRPGDTVLDCGVDQGNTVDHFLACGASTVFGFEPNPASFARLMTKYQDETRVRLFNVALSDRDGSVTLAVPENSSGAGSIVSSYSTAYAAYRKAVVSSVNVEARRLDGLALPYCDYWKIDVEGAEELVVSGAERTLARWKPRFVQIEIFGRPAHPPEYRPKLLLKMRAMLGCDGWMLAADRSGRPIRLNWSFMFHQLPGEVKTRVFRAIKRVGTPVFAFWSTGTVPELPEVDLDDVD